MTPTWLLIISWISSSGIVGFFAMGFDKARARNHEGRVPEMALFTLAFIGGAFGVVLGSGVFHHKTLKVSFAAVIYVAAIVWIALLLELQNLLGPLIG